MAFGDRILGVGESSVAFAKVNLSEFGALLLLSPVSRI